MTQYNFGVGTIIGRRTDITAAQPSFMGVMQEMDISFDQTLKELIGQYKFPVDVAQAQLKITGKAKFARIQVQVLNNLMLGQTESETAGISMAVAEPATVPTSPFTVTVSHSATFTVDLGVFYAATGKQLIPVTAGPTTGSYTVAAGVYTFSTGDVAAALLIYYEYTVTTQKQVIMSNPLMGSGPQFELYIKEQYEGQEMNMKFNACRSSKYTFPFKNVDYTINDFEFQPFADSANIVGTLSFSE